MSAVLRPKLLECDGRALFTVFHPALGRQRAAVLVCPPFLHEHALSYRLFALLGDQLAQRGIAVMRFDYHGMGDSAGTDEAFSLAAAKTDAAVVGEALRECSWDVTPIVLGVRAGALVAAALAGHMPLRGLWLWQAVFDGRRWLAELEAIDRAQRSSTQRFSNGGGERIAPGSRVLVGMPCAADFLDELAAARLERSANWPPLTLIEPVDAATDFAGARRIALAPGLHEWIAQVDIGHFLLPAVRDLADRLAASPEIPR